MRRRTVVAALCGVALAVGLMSGGSGLASSAPTTHDINTLAGKVAAVESTTGLQIRMSGFIQEEADSGVQAATAGLSSPISPTFVLSSPLDGTSVAAPDVTVNRDTAAASQNETSIAVDPNNPLRMVG